MLTIAYFASLFIMFFVIPCGMIYAARASNTGADRFVLELLAQMMLFLLVVMILGPFAPASTLAYKFAMAIYMGI